MKSGAIHKLQLQLSGVLCLCKCVDVRWKDSFKVHMIGCEIPLFMTLRR